VFACFSRIPVSWAKTAILVEAVFKLDYLAGKSLPAVPRQSSAMFFMKINGKLIKKVT
jgi:hypothetical protein